MSLLDSFKRLFKSSQFSMQFIRTNDGNITMSLNGKPYSIGKTHKNYDRIDQILQSGTDFDQLEDLINVIKIKEDHGGKIILNKYGEVMYNGEVVHNVVANRIMDFNRVGKPTGALIRFLENLMQNPNKRSVVELYSFLEHEGFPITEDGHFVAYKRVNASFKDCHTNTFDNRVGVINEMPREHVNNDCFEACSTGFHVGTHEYASDFGNKCDPIVLVKVNPRDAVSVPLDHDCHKLRVCRYEVIEVAQSRIEEPTYGDYDDDDDETCYDCGELIYDCSCEDMKIPYDDGHDAFIAGLDSKDCLYSEESEEASEWLRGWNQAQSDAGNEPKRPACSFCGAKGGKRHADDCDRPKKN